jgi:hypothetical protein
MRILPLKKIESLDVQAILSVLEQKGATNYSCTFKHILLIRNYIHRQGKPYRLSHSIIRGGPKDAVLGYTLRLKEDNA